MIRYYSPNLRHPKLYNQRRDQHKTLSSNPHACLHLHAYALLTGQQTTDIHDHNIRQTQLSTSLQSPMHIKQDTDRLDSGSQRHAVAIKNPTSRFRPRLRKVHADATVQLLSMHVHGRTGVFPWSVHACCLHGARSHIARHVMSRKADAEKRVRWLCSSLVGGSGAVLRREMPDCSVNI